MSLSIQIGHHILADIFIVSFENKLKDRKQSFQPLSCDVYIFPHAMTLNEELAVPINHQRHPPLSSLVILQFHLSSPIPQFQG